MRQFIYMNSKAIIFVSILFALASCRPLTSTFRSLNKKETAENTEKEPTTKPKQNQNFRIPSGPMDTEELLIAQAKSAAKEQALKRAEMARNRKAAEAAKNSSADISNDIPRIDQLEDKQAKNAAKELLAKRAAMERAKRMTAERRKEKEVYLADKESDAESNRLNARKKAAEDAKKIKLAEARIAAKKVAVAKLEQERIAAAKIEVVRIAAEKAAAERLEAARITAEKVAVAKLEKERIAAAKIEIVRIAAEKVAAERLEAERIAAEKVVVAKLEQERIATAKIEVARIAAEKAAAERLEAARIAAEKVVVAKLEKERIAAAKIEIARIAAEKVAAERLEAERIAEAKAKAEAKAIAAANAEKERIEKVRIAKEKVEREARAAAVIAAAKTEAERIEKERIAKEEAAIIAVKEEVARKERVRIAAEKAVIIAEKVAAEEKERVRVAAEKAVIAAAKVVAEEKERVRIAAEKAVIAAAKVAAVEKERARIAAEKVAAEEKERIRIAAEKAVIAAAKVVAAEKERARIAAEKVAITAAKVAAEEKERVRIAAERAKADKLEKERITAEKMKADELERERLIAKKAAAASDEKERIATANAKARAEEKAVALAEAKRKENIATKVENTETIINEDAKTIATKNPEDETAKEQAARYNRQTLELQKEGDRKAGWLLSGRNKESRKKFDDSKEKPKKEVAKEEGITPRETPVKQEGMLKQANIPISIADMDSDPALNKANVVPSPKLKRYYFPIQELETAKAYCFVSNNNSRDTAYWLMKSLSFGGKSYLITEKYDNNFVMTSSSRERINELGAFVEDYTAYERSGLNGLVAVEYWVEDDEGYKWNMDDGSFAMVSMNYNSNDFPNYDITAYRERHLINTNSSYVLNNKTLPTIILEDRQTTVYVDNKNNEESYPSSYENYFAEGVGLVKFTINKRDKGFTLVCTYVLSHIISYDDWQQITK